MENKEEIKDNVNHPEHYSSKIGSNIECIDGLLAAYGYEEVMIFCKLNAYKYLWRMDRKNGLEDFNKAQWYFNKYDELCKECQMKNGTK